MTGTLASLLWLVRDTVADPKAGARRVLTLDLPRAALWQALALVVVLGLLQTFAYDALMPPGTDPMMAAFRDAPLMTAAIAFAATLAMVVAMHRVGRAFGGGGGFDEALRLTVWLQTVMLVFNFVQLVLLVVVPPLAVMMGVVNLALMLWLMTNFVAVLHGFRALLPVFLMILASGLVLGFLLFYLLIATGAISVPEMPDV